jgi:hypothetical protein
LAATGLATALLVFADFAERDAAGGTLGAGVFFRGAFGAGVLLTTFSSRRRLGPCAQGLGVFGRRGL